MDGATLRYGAVLRTQYPNPISYARRLMERDEPPFVMVDPFYPPPPLIGKREMSVYRNLFGTVGCCARDKEGHLSAGTSTGGLYDKFPGRIGDSDIIGAGTYADDAVMAVSCSGIGEEFVRYSSAHLI